MVAASLTSCTSTATTTAADSSSTKSTIPQSAFRDYTGITSTTVTEGNVSTLTAGLFEGAVVGTKAYAAYVNSQGGIHGRGSSLTAMTTPMRARQQAVHPRGGGEGFCNGRELLAAGQFRGHSPRSQPAGPECDRVPRPRSRRPPEQLQSCPGSARMATRAADLLQEQVPGRRWPIPDHSSPTSRPRSASGTISGPPWSTSGTTSSTTSSLTSPRLTSTRTSSRCVTLGVKILFIEQMPQNYAAAVIRAMNLQDFHPAARARRPDLQRGAGARLPVEPPQSMAPISNSFSRCTWVRTPTRSLP